MVKALQQELLKQFKMKAIFNCSISFQKKRKRFRTSIEMPVVPEQETLKNELQIREEV